MLVSPAVFEPAAQKEEVRRELHGAVRLRSPR